MRVLLKAACFALKISIAFGIFNATVRAQERTGLKFEIASVKPTTHRNGIQLDGATFRADDSVLSFIIMAYGLGSCAARVAIGVDCPLISGMVPDWAQTVFPSTANLFEIQAKLPPDHGISSSHTSTEVREGRVLPLNLMLQALLEDRFQLRVHRERKEIPVYVLTVAKNGPRLKQADTTEFVTTLDGTSVEHHGFSAFEPVLSPNGAPTGRRRIGFQSSSMQQVADTLTSYLDRPMLDRTALGGQYDLKIEYDVDPDSTNRVGGMMTALFSGLTCAELSRSLEEAGLKCESGKGPVEVLVIDHVEKPSEN